MTLAVDAGPVDIPLLDETIGVKKSAEDIGAHLDEILDRSEHVLPASVADEIGLTRGITTHVSPGPACPGTRR
jgi:hypothetical protein